MICQQQKNKDRNNIRPCYLRNPIIVERSIDNTIFLVNPEKVVCNNLMFSG